MSLSPFHQHGDAALDYVIGFRGSFTNGLNYGNIFEYLMLTSTFGSGLIGFLIFLDVLDYLTGDVFTR